MNLTTNLQCIAEDDTGHYPAAAKVACASAAAAIERLTAENERLRAAIARIDYYYDLNDCDDMKESDAIEIDIKALRDVHRAFQQLTRLADYFGG